MNVLNKKFLSLTFGASMLLSGHALGQTWDLSIPNPSDQAGNTVSANLTINQTAGSEEAFTVDIAVGNLALFGGQGGVDLSNCLANTPPAITESCAFRPAPNDNVIRILWAANTPADAWPNTPVEMPISFTIDGGATAGDSSALTINPISFNGTVNTTDGSVTVVSGPQSTLSLTPASIDFMTVDLGNMPVTDTFTLENTGDSGTTVNVSSVAYTGDSQFSILTDNCSSQALPADGTTCDVVIEFNATANGPYSGQIDVSSDADNNDSPTGTINGEADSVASLSVTPPFGPVDLGTVVVGNSTTVNGFVENTGSADGNFGCALSGDPEISTTPDLSGPITVPAGDQVDFSLTCAVPDTASEGDTFGATLECSGVNGFDGTHDISCTATEFVRPESIPSLSQWGLIIMSFLMLMIGVVSVRFFRT
jgi:hypothetical protein